MPIFETKSQYNLLRKEIDTAIERVLERSFFVLGEECSAFEKEFAEYLGVKHVFGVANGTDAIQLALMACGVGSGDEVITTPQTALFTLLAISATGAKPVLVDIDPDTGLINPELIEAAITHRTKAIVPVHLYGQSADLDPIVQIANNYSLFIVEDSCQAHGTTYKGKYTGTIGHVGTYSFYPSKNLGCYGDGGAVVTNDSEIADRLVRLRNGGQRERYNHELMGLNSRLDEIQAAILRVKLPHLKAWNLARRERAALYNRLLEGLPLETPLEKGYGQHIYHLYVLKLSSTIVRNTFQIYLKELGIGTGIHYPIPAHLQIAYEWLGLGKGSLPQVEDTADRIISLPIFPELPLEHVEYIAESIQNFPF
ncbi:MAG: DegT/DnrJ/EryC1/StrS family aminotransferase [Chloroflexi bacterium]|uniref:DegT/DnrJ/EryC1/StrS family aminotransferase n=1 Tax=Candidatus Chlorohelix allophototropha TaxID=3003348 RepID=A0A8T7LXK5_9CHLR|nr:DegT/DnrJ/EryC1/StrS family aminotransferase [Chloroflexota bacterium]